MSVADHVRSIVEPLLAEEALECFDVEYRGGRLVVLADRPGGVDLEALTRATHRISAALDRDDPVPGGRYVLEVSSPGLERRLRTPDHFRRFLGSTVSVKCRAGAAGARRITGMLTAADEAGITVDGCRVPYDDVERARTVFAWGPAERPGAAKPTPNPAAAGPPPVAAGPSSSDPFPRNQKAPAT